MIAKLFGCSGNRYGVSRCLPRACGLWLLLCIPLLAQSLRPSAPFAAFADGFAPRALPVLFEQNTGQFPAAYGFVVRNTDGKIGIAASGITFASAQDQPDARPLRLHWVGANADAGGEGEGPSSTRTYYLSAQDDGAQPAIPSFHRVAYRNLLPGVNLEYYGNRNRLEYDFILAPGTPLSRIRLRAEGADHLEVDPEGNLRIHRDGRYVLQRKPLVYQHTEQGRAEVDSRYVMLAANEVGFAVPDYDASRPLVIDPIIEFAAYFGGNDEIQILDSAVDSEGGIYLIGHSKAAKLPGEATPPVLLPGGEPNGIFISKIAKDWNSVIFTSYLAGIGSQIAGYRLAVAPDGSVYFASGTFGPLSALPVTRPVYGAGDADPEGSFIYRTLVGKVAPTGASLLWIAGAACGTGSFSVRSLAADSEGRAIVAASATCPEFPTTPGAYEASDANAHIEGAVGVVAFEPDGEQAAYAFQFGGSGADVPVGLRLNAAAELVFGGYTASANFPVTNAAVQGALAGNRDLFFSRFSADGSTLLASTYYGGSQADQLLAFSLDAAGGIAAALQTESPSLLGTAGSFQPERAGSAILRLPASLQSVTWATYFPSVGLRDIRVDAAGNVWLLGTVSPSLNSPLTSSAILPPSEWAGRYLGRLNATGTVLTLGTALPGSNPRDSDIRLLGIESGVVSILSNTHSANFPPASTANTLTEWPEDDPRFGVYLMRVNTADPTTCSYSVSPAEVPVDWRGGTAEFTVTAPPGCPWIVFADHPGEQIFEPRQRLGGGVLRITVPAHQDSASEFPRNYYLNGLNGLEGIWFTVLQPAALCTEPTLTPSSLSFDPAGGVRSVTLDIPHGCEWNTIFPDVWASTNIPAIDTTSGPLSFWVNVPRNDFEPRSTSISIAGLTLPVSQDGGNCTSVVTVSTSAIPASGGSTTVNVTPSAPSCAWQASASARVQLGGAFSGSGNGSFTAALPSNPTNIAIQESVYVAGKTVQITQAAGECVAELTANQHHFGAQGGSVSIFVNAAGPACAWYTNLDVPWITPTHSTGQGSGNFLANISPNNTGQARSAAITILGQTVTITQSGQSTVRIDVHSQLSGIPFTVNGVTYHTPAALQLVPGAQAAFSVQEEFLHPLNYLWAFSRWSVSENRTMTFTVPDSAASLSLEGKTHPGIRVRVQGNAPGDGSRANLVSETPLYRTIGDWHYYESIVPGTSRLGQITFTAIPGTLSQFVQWTVGQHGSSTSNPWTLSFGVPMDVMATFMPVGGPGPIEEGAFATPPSLSFKTFVGVTQTLSAPVSIQKTGAAEVSFAAPVLDCGSGTSIPFALNTSGLMTPFTLTVQLNTAQIASLQPSVLNHCSVVLEPNALGQPSLTIPLTLTITDPSSETPQITALVDAASYKAGPLAIGSIATIFGTNLAQTVANADSLPLPTEFHGARLVLHREGAEHDCRLFYVSPDQINFLLPDSFPLGPATLTLYRDGVQRNSASVTIAEVSPSLFTANSDGLGAPAGHYARIQGETQVFENLFECPSGAGSCTPNPLQPREPGENEFFMVLFGTGIRYRTTQAQAFINGAEAEVTYSGPQPEFLGLDQVNIRIPRELIGTGVQDVQLRVSGRDANPVSVHF